MTTQEFRKIIREEIRHLLKEGRGLRLKLTINMENAAFEDPWSETARILKDLARKINDEGVNGRTPLMDINGNKVGEAIVE